MAQGRRVILVVAGDRAGRDEIARELGAGEPGFDLLAAAGSDEAARLLETTPGVCAVVADTVEALVEVRRRWPGLARLLVAALDPFEGKRAMVTGAALVFVARPWPAGRLRAALASALPRDPGAAQAAAQAPPPDPSPPPAPPRAASAGSARLADADLRDVMRAARERRLAPRVAARLQVEVAVASWPQFESLYSVDISRGGMLVRMPRAPREGERLRVQIALPDGRKLPFDAEVRHVAPISGPGPGPGEPDFRVGVRFVAVDPQIQATLDEILDRLGSSAGPIKLDG